MSGISAPASVTVPATDTVAADVAVRRRRLLGVGLRADLVSGADTARDLRLRRTETGVDLDVVLGIDALTQALAVGLTTLRGSDPLNARFGFLGLGPLTDTTPPPLARAAIRSAVAQLVADEPRVRRVVDVTVTPPAPGSRVLRITASFDTVTGDAADLASAGPPGGAATGTAVEGAGA